MGKFFNLTHAVETAKAHAECITWRSYYTQRQIEPALETVQVVAPSDVVEDNRQQFVDLENSFGSPLSKTA